MEELGVGSHSLGRLEECGDVGDVGAVCMLGGELLLGANILQKWGNSFFTMVHGPIYGYILDKCVLYNRS